MTYTYTYNNKKSLKCIAAICIIPTLLGQKVVLLLHYS